MLLRCAGIISYNAPHTSKKWADVVLSFKDIVVVLEFKFSKTSSEVKDMKSLGAELLHDREYTMGYELKGRRIISVVLVADDECRKIIL